MKILFFNYEYPPLGGGAANATEYILKEFSRIPDLDVELVTSSIDGCYHLDRLGDNILIHRLPIGKNKKNLHFQSQKDLLMYSWKAYRFSVKLCKEKTFDVSHSFFAVPCGFLSMKLKKMYGIPYIVSLRGSDVPGYSDRFTALYRALTPLIRRIWSRADAVVANSEGLRALARESDSKREFGLIYNGIDIRDFAPDPGKRPHGGCIITSGASRVTTRKGLEYLIAAVGILVPRYPQIRLKIMGEGDDRVRLEGIVKKSGLEGSVEFLGRVPREETAKYYQEASIFVLPSFNEGMSNAMLEALASGLPILATDTGGTKELVTDGDNGFIIRMKDAKDIAEKIELLAGDSATGERMGGRSRERAEALSWEKVAMEYADLYRASAKRSDS